MNDQGQAGGARLLESRAIAGEMLGEIRRDIADLAAMRGFTPQIGVMLVGDDDASTDYAHCILKTAETVGSVGQLVRPDVSVTSVLMRHLVRAARAQASTGYSPVSGMASS